MTDFVVTAFISFFVVVDPPGIAPLFVALTQGMPPHARRRTAFRGVAIAGCVLLAFALGGNALLGALGIGIPAFRVAGGILLLLLAIEMVMVRHTGLRATTPGEDDEASHRHDVSVFPLAVPLIAGPGAIATVVLKVGDSAGDLVRQAVLLIVLASVLALTALTLLGAGRLLGLAGQTGLNVVSRVFGIILAALAVQLMIDGLRVALWE